MGSRTWIKIYCDKWLNGTIREESLEVRAVWVDLLVLAGSGKYGDSGEIKITDSIGFLDTQLADLLQISTRKWKIISKRLQETDRICVHQNNVIAIKNWSKYQSEYERTKRYRTGIGDTKSTPQSTPQSTAESTAREGEGRGERGEPLPSSPPLQTTAEISTDISDLYLILQGSNGFPGRSNGNVTKLIEVMADYPGCDYALEFKKFREYWSKRKLKNPWLALRNWLDKAGRHTDGKAQNPRTLPKKYTPTRDYDDL